MRAYSLVRGRLSEVLAGLPDNSFDGLLCDPPYGFRFMGKSWDYDVPSVEDWRACLRVLKPGAALLAFGGARTYHRIVLGIEDAGFEVRDQLMWMYAKGFPKSLNVSKSIDGSKGVEQAIVRAPDGTLQPIARVWEGYGTALKPGFEPICLARKPLEGTVAENVTRWGVGALAIDACRIGDEPHEINRFTDGAKPFGGGAGHAYESATVEGRWPANLMFDEAAAAEFDAEVGPRKSGMAVRENGGGGQIFSDIGGNGYKPKPPLPNVGYMDGKTNPSRFFFCTKVGRKERERGCEGLALKSAGEMTEREDESAGLSSPRAGAGRTGGARNHHPTLKPVALTEYLARLIMPPTSDAVLLVPYAGAGSEMIGALAAGWPMVFGIELDLDEHGQPAGYIDIARARLKSWHPDAAIVE